MITMILQEKEGKSMEEKITYRSILKQKEFLKLMMAGFINRFGDSIDAIASAWIVYQLTNNAAWSAIIFGINKLPTVFVTPLVGPWAESHNKKRIMIVTDIIRALCVAFVATGYLLGFLEAWMLMITTLIISTVEAFRSPASMVMTSLVLESKYYEHGISLSSTVSSIIELVGTAMAGGIIAVVGIAGAIYIDMGTFLASAFIEMFIRTKEEKKERERFNAKEYMSSLTEGIQYLHKNSVLWFYLCAAVFLNATLVPFNSLQAPLANEIFKSGAEILSFLGAAVTSGLTLGTFCYPFVKEKLKKRTIFYIGSMCIGVYYGMCVLCMPFYGEKWFRYGFVVMTGLMFGSFVSLLMALFQIEFKIYGSRPPCTIRSGSDFVECCSNTGNIICAEWVADSLQYENSAFSCIRDRDCR